MSEQGLSPKEKQKYIKSGGNYCPFCQSEDIGATGHADLDGPSARQLVECFDCESEWTDVYTLSDIEVEASD